MVTLAFVADSQVDERSRLEEHDRVMRFVVEDSARRGACALLHGGDVYERRSTERERRSVGTWIVRALAEGMAVYIAGGNHEAAGEVAELGEVYRIEADEVPEMREDGEVAIATLPWPRRASVAAWLASRDGAPAGSVATDEAARELLRDVLRWFGARFRDLPPGMPRVLLAHAEIDGYTTDSDQPACGGGMRVSVEDLMLAEADIVLVGHVHKPQHWIGRRADGVEVPVIYAGSPRRTAYAKGELVEKGYVLVQFDGRTPRWERVPTPATPMRLVEWSYGGEMTDPPAVAGVEIRLRYEVPAERRAEARLRVHEVADRWRAAGAREVQVEEVVLPTTRARSPEVAAARGVGAKLRAMYAARGGVETERAERLVGIAEEIEAEVLA